MTDPIIIERTEIQEIVDKAITRTLSELGIKASEISPWITQNKAAKLVGQKRLERAMRNGLVEWHKEDINRPHSRVWIAYKDIIKLIKNPQKK